MRGLRPSEISEELSVSVSDVRSAIRILKTLGLPISRTRGFYTLRTFGVNEPNIVGTNDLLLVLKDVTKTIRFFYGEEVRYLWPYSVLNGTKEVARISPEAFQIMLEEPFPTLLKFRAQQAIRKRRHVPEAVRTLNALLYKGKIKLELNDGKILKGELINITIDGLAKIKMENEVIEINREKVKRSLPLHQGD